MISSLQHLDIQLALCHRLKRQTLEVRSSFRGSGSRNCLATCYSGTKRYAHWLCQDGHCRSGACQVLTC